MDIREYTRRDRAGERRARRLDRGLPPRRLGDVLAGALAALAVTAAGAGLLTGVVYLVSLYAHV